MLPLTAAITAILSTLSPIPPDHTAPTRPAPLAVDVSSGVTLHWAPSTDDQGPVRYEVYANGRLVIVQNGTSFRYSPYPPPPMIFIFSVRAVDAAGNSSASSYNTLGRIWRGDEPAPAPTCLRFEPTGTSFKFKWTAPEVSPSPSVPPVAGYEVLLDGRPVTQVGGTSAELATPAPGTHTVGVRTLNAVDQLSAPAEVTFDVD
jgi:hypothetical protein